MKKVYIIILLLLVFGNSYGQVAVAYFPLNNTFIQLSTNPERLIFGDIRYQTNSFSYNTTVELAPYINIKRWDALNLYAGIGMSYSPFYNTGSDGFNFYFLTIGARIKPLTFNRNWAILFELSPVFNSTGGNNMLRSSIGISYNFVRKHARNTKTTKING